MVGPLPLPELLVAPLFAHRSRFERRIRNTSLNQPIRRGLRNIRCARSTRADPGCIRAVASPLRIWICSDTSMSGIAHGSIVAFASLSIFPACGSVIMRKGSPPPSTRSLRVRRPCSALTLANFHAQGCISMRSARTRGQSERADSSTRTSKPSVSILSTETGRGSPPAVLRSSSSSDSAGSSSESDIGLTSNPLVLRSSADWRMKRRVALFTRPCGHRPTTAEGEAMTLQLSRGTAIRNACSKLEVT
mmetsp:Transcript_38378/g.84338  ORF Transcript_38378/g.84338 Transcript_38378/m.84338 type:complete len:248 (+) Transcript_38378:1135-1878(+)|eukprot:4604010-Pleurochrysis_carterae.AAC.2